MAIRANPKLITELEVYGAQDVSKCYHCGNCSATCPFSKEPYIFPRRSMRSLQMGLEAKLESDLEPWLCYYCGECSTECPARCRAGRDHDEPPPLAHGALRFHRHRAPVLPVGEGRDPGGDPRGAAHRRRLPALWVLAGKHHPVRRRRRLPARPPASTSSTGPWRQCFSPYWAPTACACGGSRSDATRRSTSPSASYVKKLYLLPMHFFTQMRYAKCEKKRPWAPPPRAHAELRDHAGPDHVLP